jgi:hypothetical protein
VFLENAPVLDGHFPTREIDQARAVGGMEITQWRAVEIAH